MGKHDKTLLEKARDELFSHIQSCNVLQAAEEDQDAWMGETMEYMAERYPELSELQLAQLRMFGERYIAPAIPHGRGSADEEDEAEAEEEAEAEVEAEVEVEVEAEVEVASASARASEDDGGGDDSDSRAA